MMSMKRLCFLIFTAACATNAFSQATNCTQVLRLVRSTYEQGRLHELPTLMEGCLHGVGDKGFTKADKREAYRYLTLAYIYLEEPEKADESMLKLLDTDHFFQINQALDPAEFIALYNKFRHEPLYWVNFKVGFNVTQPVVTKAENIGSTSGGQGSYALSVALQFSAAWEKAIGKKIMAAPEIGLINRGYEYTNTSLAISDEDPNKYVSSLNYAVKQSWFDLNAIFYYKFKDTQELKTFVGGGPGISYLLSSTNQASTVLGNGFTITGSSIDDIKSYNKLLYSFTLMAGVKKKFAEFYVTADVRYQIGLSSAIDNANRTTPSGGYDYQIAYNDFRMNNASLNLGVSYPIFKPKKLIK